MKPERRQTFKIRERGDADKRERTIYLMLYTLSRIDKRAIRGYREISGGAVKLLVHAIFKLRTTGYIIAFLLFFFVHTIYTVWKVFTVVSPEFLIHRYTFITSFTHDWTQREMCPFCQDIEQLRKRAWGTESITTMYTLTVINFQN